MTATNLPITIAVADDNPIFRVGLIKLIGSFPDCKVVLEEEDCEEMLLKISDMPAPPQLCIIDMAMPGGYAMLKEAKSRFPDMKIMVLSVASNELSVIRTIKIGVNGFLLKTCNREELHRAIQTISQQGSYFAENRQEMEAKSRESVLLQLSYEELEMLSLCATELPLKSIAEKAGITIRAVEKYLETLYQKIGVTSRIGLVLFALNMGLKPAKQGQPSASQPS